jgi:PAS domain S-box-containing protein
MAFLAADGTIVTANPALAALLGRDRPHLEGTAIESHLLSADHESWRAFFDAFRGDPQAPARYESAFRRSGTDDAWWGLTLATLGEGSNPPFFAVLEDLTDRRAAEQRLREARRLAEGANRAKSEFLANMSHEIRTPLFTITGMTDLLRLGDLKRDQAHHAGQIATAAQHLLDLVNDVLDFSKIEAGQMSLESIPLDLDDVVGRSLEVVSLQAYRKGIELVLDLDPSVPRRWLGDPSRLRQVLVNLLGNAVKFTHQGRVTLVVEPGPTIRVRDTGIGISASARESLFQAFTQADSSTTRQYGGTGLGLAISQKLVGLLGGRIEFTSQPGVGTEFFFTLDLPPEGGAATVPPRADGRSVLVVDDDPGVREVLAHRLREAGFVVAAVASRAEARSALAQRRPDVVLIDQELGPEDGWQLASEVRADPSTADLPLVLMSLLRKTLEPSPRYPADLFRAFVDKPVNTRTLVELLAAGVEGRWADAPGAVGAEGLLGRALQVRSPDRLKILVAEDHEVNRELFRLLLRSLGHEAVLVENGKEACDVALEARPQLIFMDLQMPVMNGYEATRALRQQGLTCPIVAVTASALKGELERCRAAGMDGILTKPFNLETLDSVIRSYAPRASDSAVAVPLPDVVRPAPQAEAFSYDEALKVFLGNRDLLVKLIGKFRVQTQATLVRLEQAWTARDAAELRAGAHALKGSAANLTARSLAQAAEVLEHEAADGQIEATPERLAALHDRFRDFEAAVAPLG